MTNDIKVDSKSAFKVSRSRDFYRGKSFYFAGEWKQGCHYIEDDYISHYITYKHCLLKCIKSHLSTINTEPKDLIFDDSGACIGVNSEYWEFVLSGIMGNVTKDDIIEMLGYIPANQSDLDTKVDKIDGLGLSKNDFTDAFKEKLENLNVQYNTTEYWNATRGFVPKKGEIIIYSDYKTKNINDTVVTIPGIKIGSGNGYVQDLRFLNEDQADLIINHINDNNVHITSEERMRWNNKINITDGQDVIEETLIFNRN